VGGTLQVWRWLSSATGLALFAIAFAALVSLLAGPTLWQWLATPLSWIGSGIETVLFFILVAFAYFFFLLLTPITWVLRRYGSGNQPLPQQPPAFPTFHEAADHARFGLPPILRFGLELAVGISLAAVILLLVVRGLRRYHIATREESAQDIHEATWSRALVMEQIRGFLRRPTQKRAQRRVPTAPQTVREAYQAVLWLLSEYGLSRRAPETPLDYLARLQHMLNETTSTFADLTARYLVARYGEGATSEDDAAAVADWQALRRSLYARSAQQRQGKRPRGTL
jgi:large-conductance mechanosensitive channel